MEQRETVSKENYGYREDFREPKRYVVFVINEDMTPFDFVVHLMMDVFGKSEEDGWMIADRTHHHGKALVGRYTCDMAHTKVNKAIRLSRENGYPLNFTIEPEAKK